MPHKIHRHLPSINVTTPTTATTQIILSNTPTRELASPAHPEEEQVQKQQQQRKMELKSPASPSPISSASSHSYASPAQSPTRQSYERLTTKSILARSSNINNNNNAINNNNNNYSVSGYLHGCNGSSASSYSSYATSMTSSSLASASASSITKAIESRTRAKTGSLKYAH